MVSLYEAIILVVLVSLVGFWEWRSAMLMALAIPITLAMTFGMMQVLTRRVIGRISPVAVNSCRLWIAVGLLSLTPGMATSALRQGREFWAFVALAGLFGPFLGRLFIMYSLRGLRAAHSALLLLLAPVLAFVIGFVGQGSVPSGQELAGGFVVLAGVALPSLAVLRGERVRP